jgi:hypothetical protein
MNQTGTSINTPATRGSGGNGAKDASGRPIGAMPVKALTEGQALAFREELNQMFDDNIGSIM